MTVAEPDTDRPAAPPVEYEADFPCGLQHPVARVGPDHFRVDYPAGHSRQEAGFFLFALRNVAGRTVTVDLMCERAGYWRSLNPVYADLDPALPVAEQLADPALYACRPPPDLGRNVELPQGLGGSKLPVTHGIYQRWQYMPDSGTNPDRRSHYRIRHTFPADAPGLVAVSMRVPYTPQLLDRLVADLQTRHAAEAANTRRGEPDWAVVRVGNSAEGRPLWLIRIGEAVERDPDQPPFAPPPKEKRSKRPVILFYAREHADEHDTSWVAQGVIDFLLSDHRDAKAIRKRATVLIVPLLDPDGAVKNLYETEVIFGFEDDPGRPPEALAYAEWFRDWVDAGNRLDLVFNLHNVESGEGPHLFPYMWERPTGSPRHVLGKMLHHTVASRLTNAGFNVAKDASGFGLFSTRLGGWLRKYFGTHMTFYEVNSQAPQRHLSLYEVKAVGVHLIIAAIEHCFTNEGRWLLRNVESEAYARWRRWNRYGWMKRVFGSGKDVFDRESTCAILPTLERVYAPRPDRPSWIGPLFERYGSGGPPSGIEDDTPH